VPSARTEEVQDRGIQDRGSTVARVARHAKRRRKSQRRGEPAWSDESRFETDLRAVEPSSEPGVPEPDWFAPSALGEDVYAARQEVPLAAMLMLGEHAWQRIDGMGLARQALEAPASRDLRVDLSDDERFLLANGRAWCLVVHSDLGHGGRRDDPIVLADAQRHVEQAQRVATKDVQQAQVLTTGALVIFRREGSQGALAMAQTAVDAFAVLPDHERTGQSQGIASLAVLTLALLTAASGDTGSALSLARAAGALRPPLDVDQAAFGALLKELSEWISAH
jgi:hypothetical protein